MSDLISRSAVIEFVKEELKQDRPYDFKIKNIQRFIEDMPTAYDVEKVVAELKNKSLKCKMESAKIFCEDDYRNNTLMQYVKQSEDMKAFAYDKAIEIVKAGGIDG